MRPLNVDRLQEKIAALSSELSDLELKRDKVIGRRPKLAASDRPAFFREVTQVFDTIKKTERPLHVAKRLLARAQGDEYALQVP